MSSAKPIIALATGPVFDVRAFRKCAYWLSRANLPPGSLAWTVVVDPEYANAVEVEKILRSFSANFFWELVKTKKADNQDDGNICRIAYNFMVENKSKVKAYLASDAIVLPDVLPAVVEQVEKNPTCVVVAEGKRISPADLLNLDSYGSNLLVNRIQTSPHIWSQLHEVLLAAWKSESAFPGDPDIPSNKIVYSQLDRGEYPGWDKKCFAMTEWVSSQGETS